MIFKTSHKDTHFQNVKILIKKTQKEIASCTDIPRVNTEERGMPSQKRQRIPGAFG